MVKKFLTSVNNAWRGLKWVVFHEKNFKIQILILLCAILLGVFLKISSTEWFMVIIVSALVLMSEIINTCVEQLCNFIHPEQNKQIGKIKDIAASVPLIASIISLLIGVYIFLPKVFKIF